MTRCGDQKRFTLGGKHHPGSAGGSPASRPERASRPRSQEKCEQLRSERRLHDAHAKIYNLSSRHDYRWRTLCSGFGHSLRIVRKAVVLMRGLWQMSRPLILPSGVLAYAVGVAMARYAGHPLIWGDQALALTLTMLANLAAHYADEYADADTDALAVHTGISGGSGAIAAGLATRTLALNAALFVSALTIVVGIGAVLIGRLPLAAGLILLIGLMGGWAYSLPPLALERRGWGEITNALLGGLLMPLMAYATAAHHAPPLEVYLQLAPMVAAALTCI
ncbi:MAG: prenyltransferase, partial [Chloroflexia bacterium]|nr:prenyltransferase [Chloroflexia bacterium]